MSLWPDTIWVWNSKSSAGLCMDSMYSVYNSHPFIVIWHWAENRKKYARSFPNRNDLRAVTITMKNIEETTVPSVSSFKKTNNNAKQELKKKLLRSARKNHRQSLVSTALFDKLMQTKKKEYHHSKVATIHSVSIRLAQIWKHIHVTKKIPSHDWFDVCCLCIGFGSKWAASIQLLIYICTSKLSLCPLAFAQM